MPPAPEQKRPELILPVVLPPGFDRDHTTFSAERCVDGQWVRWQNGRARKIGGYAAATVQPNGTARHLRVSWVGTTGYVHLFSEDTVSRMTLTSAGVLGAVTDRTPAGFTISSNNNWQTAILFDEASGANVLLAHCTDNLNDLGTGTSRPVYYGELSNTPVLTSTGHSIDGGICVLQPYLFLYGSGGEIQWSDANKPLNVGAAGGGDAGADRITGSKIVRGYSTSDTEYVTGGGSGATGLFWSLDSLIAARYVGGTAIFKFQTINDEEISVLSSNAIVRHEGVFFWPGVDQFYMFDGKVKTLPNDSNLDWFFDNLDFTYRQKVWATVNERYGEIWWHFPYQGSTECSRALIFNVHETARTGKPVWYDSTIARAAGDTPHVFRWPLWADTADPATLYRHEVGTDAVDTAAVSTAINSYIVSPTVSFAEQNLNDWVLLKRVEHDIDQTGDMTLNVIGREYARSADTTSGNYTVTSTTTKTDLIEQRRQMRLKWTSNTVGGDYVMGKNLLHIQQGSGQ